jgi:hypothetical protein
MFLKRAGLRKKKANTTKAAKVTFFNDSRQEVISWRISCGVSNLVQTTSESSVDHCFGHRISLSEGTKDYVTK